VFHRIKKASSFVRNVQALCRDRKKPCPIYCTILAICSARSQVHQEMRDQKKHLLAVLCGKTESNCYLHTNSVTEPPPGRPHRTHTQFAQILNCESSSRYFFGRRRGIAYGCVGADSPTQCIRFINPTTPGSGETDQYLERVSLRLQSFCPQCCTGFFDAISG